MEIKNAKYLTSVTKGENILLDETPEFAFVGRSNVGKSSLINCLLNKKGLARTSAQPGKTQMINYFLVNDKFRFVDLPGYGFAKADKTHKEMWANVIGEYLIGSESLLNVFVLLDVRRTPSELDKKMIEFLIFNGISFSVVITKTDKVAKGKLKSCASEIAKVLKLREEAFFFTSSASAAGRKILLDFIENKLEMNI